MQIVPSTWLTYDSVAFKYKAGSTAIINLVTRKVLSHCRRLFIIDLVALVWLFQNGEMGILVKPCRERRDNKSWL